MPSNLYGVANAPVFAVKVNPGGTSCPAGAETNIISSPALVAPSQGFFYCLCIVNTLIVYGASVANPISINARIGAGADFDTYGINTAGIVASSNVLYPCAFLTPTPSSVAWTGAGSIVNISITPTANAVSTTGIGTFAVFLLLRAPDQ